LADHALQLEFYLSVLQFESVDTCRIFLHTKPPCWVEVVCYIFNHGLHVCTCSQ